MRPELDVTKSEPTFVAIGSLEIPVSFDSRQYRRFSQVIETNSQAHTTLLSLIGLEEPVNERILKSTLFRTGPAIDPFLEPFRLACLGKPLGLKSSIQAFLGRPAHIVQTGIAGVSGSVDSNGFDFERAPLAAAQLFDGFTRSKIFEYLTIYQYAPDCWVVFGSVGEKVWLLFEWSLGEDEPTFSTWLKTKIAKIEADASAEVQRRHDYNKKRKRYDRFFYSSVAVMVLSLLPFWLNDRAEESDPILIVLGLVLLFGGLASAIYWGRCGIRLMRQGVTDLS